jgi:hypothetical protein
VADAVQPARLEVLSHGVFEKMLREAGKLAFEVDMGSDGMS